MPERLPCRIGAGNLSQSFTQSNRINWHFLSTWCRWEGVRPLLSCHRSIRKRHNDDRGDYEYQIIPPADAIPSIIDTVIFAKGIDDASEPVEPNNIFSPQDTIFLFGYGDIGNLSTLQAEWIVSDEVIIEDCSAFLTADQNYSDDQFYFSCALVDGWPTGTHSVLLTMDDIEIIDESFTIE